MTHRHLALGIAAFAVHTALVLAFILPPEEVFSREPLASVDYALHYYHMTSDLKSERAIGTTAGYDPFFMAGFPQGIFDVEVKWLVVAGRLVPEGWLPRLFNLSILTLALLPPVLLAGIASLLELGLAETAALLVLGVLQFFLAWPVNLVATGMVSFLATSYLAIFAWALFVRGAAGRSILASAGLLLVCPFAVLIHPFFAIIAAPLLALALAALPRGAWGRGVGLIGGAALTSLAANLPWVLPVFRRLGETTQCGVFWQNTSRLAPLIEYLPSLNGMKLLATGLAVAGVWPQRGGENDEAEAAKGVRERRVMIALLGAAAFLYVLSYYGAFLPLLANLEPMRFVVPFETCLLVPSARGLTRGMRAWVPRMRTPRIALFSALIALVLAHSSLFASHVYWLTVTRERIVRHARDYRAYNDLVQWIVESTDDRHRILIEEGAWRWTKKRFASDYLEALLPLFTHRSFIGGPYPWYCLRHGEVGFGNGKLIERDLASYSREELSAALSRYAIGWVLAWSPGALRELEKGTLDPGGGTDGPARILTHTGHVGPYAVFRVTHPEGLFLAGSGDIDVDYGRLRFTGVEPGADGATVVKLHCDPRLRAPTGMALSCFDVPGDPVGFLRIDGARGDFEVRAGEPNG